MYDIIVLFVENKPRKFITTTNYLLLLIIYYFAVINYVVFSTNKTIICFISMQTYKEYICMMFILFLHLTYNYSDYKTQECLKTLEESHNYLFENVTFAPTI